MNDVAADRSEAVRPYVPRLLLQWVAEAPETRFRELEGSVVFVDISGFTAMSERLARLGKFGAEEITGAIESCFTALLAVAYANGGGLLKFGGDALLLFFAGEGHTERACRSAVWMRRTLREVGRLETLAGLVRLRMSVGVHRGLFHFFLAGDSHRELVITGPAASETVEMESAAAAGEIVVSPATSASLPASALGAPKGPGILLRRAPTSARFEAAEDVPITAGVEACIPVAIREHVLAGSLEPEHRQVTVAFVHFDGVDALIAEEGTERVADALDALVGEVQRAAAKHGVTFLGTDVDRDGGKVILVAGAPEAIGDDEERMLLTLRAIVECAPPIPVRIGVNTGHVFAGEIGPPYRRTYTVMGDAVNLAARVMARAESGQILAAEGVLEASSVAFETRALEAFSVKGKRKPVQAFEVGAVEGSKRLLEEHELALVGRETEMRVLTQALAEAHEGRGRVVEVVGPPGIGKTRLLQELLALAEGSRVVAAACELYEATTPYAPVRRLLRQALDIPRGADDRAAISRLRERVAEAAPYLLPWLPLVTIPLDLDVGTTPEVELLEEEFRKAKLDEVVTELFGSLLGGPTVFALEDAHWMDDASADVLRSLARRTDERPWLFCLTRREEPTGLTAPDGSLVVRPEPLRREDVEALIASATKEAPLRPDDVVSLVERSGGNPLFVRELVRVIGGVGGAEGLPGSLEGIVTVQIDRLPSTDRRVLRYASVLGSQVDPSIVAELLDGDGIPAPPSVWRRLGEFLLEDEHGTLGFRHALMRDAAYEGLPFRLRRQLHARVGASIERRAGDRPEDEAALLSLHFFHAQRFDSAWRYSRIAGSRAQSRFAVVEAAALFERALSAARRLADVPAPDVAEVHETLGDLRDRMGKYPDAKKAYGLAARALLDDVVLQAKLCRKRSWLAERAGRYPQALRWVRRGLAAIEGLGGVEASRQRARLTVWYAVVRQQQGHQRDAIKWCEEGIREAERAGERDALAHAYFVLDLAYEALGQTDNAVYSERALAIYEELGNLGRQAVIWGNQGTTAYWQGRWDEARELYERAREAFAKVGDVASVAISDANIAEILSDQGKLEEAEELFRSALRMATATEFHTMIAFCLSNLGRVACRAGRYDEALATYAEARRMFEEDRVEVDVLETDVRIAECYVLQGRAPEALEIAEDGLRRARAMGGAHQEPALHRLRGQALAQLGDLKAARDALDRSLEAGRSRDALLDVATTLLAIAQLARARGVVDLDAESEARSLLDRLGIASVPEPRIPAAVG